MLSYIAEGTLQLWLSEKCFFKKMYCTFSITIYSPYALFHLHPHLKWEDYPGLSARAYCNHKLLPSERWGQRQGVHKEREWWKRLSEGCRCWLSKWRKGPQAQKCMWPIESRKGKEMIFPWSLQRNVCAVSLSTSRSDGLCLLLGSSSRQNPG